MVQSGGVEGSAAKDKEHAGEDQLPVASRSLELGQSLTIAVSVEKLLLFSGESLPVALFLGANGGDHVVLLAEPDSRVPVIQTIKVNLKTRLLKRHKRCVKNNIVILFLLFKKSNENIKSKTQ